MKEFIITERNGLCPITVVGTGLPAFLGMFLADKILNRKRNKPGTIRISSFHKQTVSFLQFSGCRLRRAAASLRNETFPAAFLKFSVTFQSGQ